MSLEVKQYISFHPLWLTIFTCMRRKMLRPFNFQPNILGHIIWPFSFEMFNIRWLQGIYLYTRHNLIYLGSCFLEVCIWFYYDSILKLLQFLLLSLMSASLLFLLSNNGSREYLRITLSCLFEVLWILLELWYELLSLQVIKADAQFFLNNWIFFKLKWLWRLYTKPFDPNSFIWRV